MEGNDYVNFDYQNVVSRLIKYCLEGIAVAAAFLLISKKTPDLPDVALLALTAAAVYAILDVWAPTIADGARHGTGFGLGATQVGFPAL